MEKVLLRPGLHRLCWCVRSTDRVVAVLPARYALGQPARYALGRPGVADLRPAGTGFD